MRVNIHALQQTWTKTIKQKLIPNIKIEYLQNFAKVRKIFCFQEKRYIRNKTFGFNLGAVHILRKARKMFVEKTGYLKHSVN